MGTLALFVRSLTTGGAEHVAARLSEIWVNMGWSVVIVSSTPLSRHDYSYSTRAVEVIDFDLMDVTKMKALHDKYDFDMAIFNSCWEYPWFEKIVDCLHESCMVKVIHVMHHSFANWMFMLVCLSELSGKEGLLQKIDAFVCVDKLSALWWSRAGAKAVYLPNPVDANREQTNPHKYSHQIIWIGRVGDPGKRIDLMLKIFVRVKNVVPDAKLLVYGVVDRSLERRLLSKLPTTAVAAISFQGFNPELSKEIAKGGIHAFTSLVEASPQVFPESQAVGLPTVTFDLPVLLDYSESNGVVKVSNEDSFVEALTRGLIDQSWQRELSNRAYQSYSSNDNDACCRNGWRHLFVAMQNDDAKIFQRDYDTEDVQDELFREMRRASAYMASEYVPSLLWLRKWRRRAKLSIMWPYIQCCFGKLLRRMTLG